MNTTTYTAKRSSELEAGDIVHVHGMQVRLDSLTTFTTPGNDRQAYSWKGTVLNLEEVLAEGFIPASFIHDHRTGRHDYWVIQGNDLVTWAVAK